MSKSLVEIKGFKELEAKIKKLSDDKSKRKEVTKILGQLANPTLKVARQLAPVSKKPHTISGKNRAKRTFQPGNLRKSLGKKTMRRSAIPMIVIRANSRKSADGFYGRQFVIPGTRNQDPQPFTEKAQEMTKGKVTADGVRKMEKYIQKQIDRLI